MTADPDMMDEALELAAMGFAVFPLNPRGKKPLRGTTGFKDARTDPEDIRVMWRADRSRNIGVATGHGLMVLDVDCHEADGGASLREWEAENGELPKTWAAETGSGGEHLWFRIPEGVEVHCAAGVLDGVDVRGDGGYVVAPPSIHPDTGRPYTWEVAPDECECALMPDALVELCETAKNADGLTFWERPEKVVQGNRDNALFGLLTSMRAREADELDALEEARRYNATFEPPFDDAYVVSKVKQVWKQYAAGLSEEGRAAKERRREKPKGEAPQTLSSKRFDHVSIAEELMHGERRACFVDGIPAVFDPAEGRWRTGWDAIDRAITDTRHSATEAQRKEVRGYLKLYMPNEKQADPRYIAFGNGVLDVMEMQLLTNAGEQVILNTLPVDWNPDAKCRLVDDTLGKMSHGDLAVLRNLQEIAGLCMFRSNRYGVAPVLLGSGSNGKSTYIAMLGALLGRDSVSALDIAKMGKDFMNEQVAGKLANLADDIGNETIGGDRLADFKKIVTGDYVFSNVKGKSPITFRPYCTVVISANEFPHLKDTTEGMMRRLHPIPFDAHFSTDDEDYDPDILEKLTAPEALSRFAYMGVMGLRMVMDARGLTTSARQAELKNEISESSSTILQWLADDEIGAEAVINHSTAEIYTRYCRWCADNGIIKHATKRTVTNVITQHLKVKVSATTYWMDGASRRRFEAAD